MNEGEKSESVIKEINRYLWITWDKPASWCPRRELAWCRCNPHLNYFQIFFWIIGQYFSELFDNISLDNLTIFLIWIILQNFSCDLFQNITQLNYLPYGDENINRHFDFPNMKYDTESSFSSCVNQHLNMLVLIAFRLVQGGFSSPISLLLFSLKSSPLYEITSCHSSFHFLAINTSFHFLANTVYEMTSCHSPSHFVANTV